MDSSADVEKLQDVIRQLEVQNQKLRNRGTNRINTSANNNDTLNGFYLETFIQIVTSLV